MTADGEPSDSARVDQEIDAGRDAHVAARDLTIINYYGAGPQDVRGSALTAPQADDAAPAEDTTPAVWNLPARNPVFSGRGSVLTELRDQIVNDHRGVVHALTGMGGVGKTQLVLEYAHRFSSDYRLAWWIDAEQPELIGEQMTSLGQAAGWIEAGAAVEAACRVVLDRLRRTRDWLIVFDNVVEPEHVRQWLPQGPGHVIITARHRNLTGIARPVQVEVFSRGESIEFLMACLPALVEPDASVLAEALGDLPLALVQAAGLIAETAMPAAEYLEELAGHASELLAEARPFDYPVALAAALDISVDRLTDTDQAGVELLRLMAFLAPDPVTLGWIRNAPSGALPEALAQVANRPLALRRTLARLGDLGLAQVSGESLQLHRLTQAVLRDQQTADEQAAMRDRATQLVAGAAPGNDGVDPESWPAWAAVLPHLLALDPATAPSRIRPTACDAIWYLLMRGEYNTALPLAENWRLSWMREAGPDDYCVLWIASHLGELYRFLGKHQEAHDINHDTLDRRRRTEGPYEFHTMISASNLAINLHDLGRHQEALELNQDTLGRWQREDGEDTFNYLSSANNLARNLSELGRHQEAHDLDRDTLARRRSFHGIDHPRTLTSASNLAGDLRDLNRYEEAYELDRDTFGRRRRVLGADHPETLDSASNLAADQHALGNFDAARQLDEDTLDRRRRLLGPDHPDTLDSASNLAADLYALGDVEAARELEQDALDRRRRVLGPRHPETLRAERNLGPDRRHLGGRSPTASN